MLVYFRKHEKGKRNVRYATFFLLLGLAGSLPLTLTLVQRGFYTMPSIAFFALGFSLLLSKPVTALAVEFMNEARLRSFSLTGIILLIAVIAFSVARAGKPGRDKETLHDVYEMGKIVKAKTIIGAPEEMYNHYTFEAYLMRHFEISMVIGNSFDYFILPKNSRAQAPHGFSPIGLESVKYDLYKRD